MEMESTVARAGRGMANGKHTSWEWCGGASSNAATNTRGGGGGEFQMPLHYPRYSKADYENMPEWKLDCLLTQYGLPSSGSLQHKRAFAIGAFLWA